MILTRSHNSSQRTSNDVDRPSSRNSALAFGDDRLDDVHPSGRLSNGTDPRSASARAEGDNEDGMDDAFIPPCADNMTSVFLPKINYVTLMLGRETESSADMESLALKYLKVMAVEGSTYVRFRLCKKTSTNLGCFRPYVRRGGFVKVD